MPDRQRTLAARALHARMYGNSLHRCRTPHPRLRHQGKLALDETIQSKIVAMAFSMRRDRTRPHLRPHNRSPARQKSLRPAARSPERTWQEQAGPIPARNRSLLANGSTQAFIAKRYNTTPANLSTGSRKRHRPSQTLKSCGGFGTFVGLDPDTG